MIAFVVLGLILLALSVRGRRRRGPGREWRFVASAALAGVAVAPVGGGVLVALLLGRTTWNSWAAGTPQREGVTLAVILVGVPVLLAVSGILLLAGILAEKRRPSGA